MTNGTDNRIERLIRPEIRALKAYHVPPAQGLIKLDAMENPYHWPAELTQAWLEAMRGVELNRYPDPAAQALRAQLRASWHISAESELLLGNGSDELIQIILMACAQPGASVLAPAPSFVMYSMIAGFVGMKFVPVPLADDFALDVAAMHKAIGTHKPAVVFLSYPNNPTGNLFDEDDVEELIAETEGLVVVDEAYHPFCQQSFLDRLTRHDNLLVLRTFSKLGLAGLRLGVLAGASGWLHEFDKVRLPYNINVLTQASVRFALEHAEVLEAQAAQIRRDREALFAALSRMPGVRPWPSAANFILFRVEGRSATEVFEHLKHRHVLIKNLDTAGSSLAGCLRVTVGTSQENAAFLAALEKSL
jgi:histidinol-phosphate aminotransferase